MTDTRQPFQLTPVFDPPVWYDRYACWTTDDLSNKCQRAVGDICGCRRCLARDPEIQIIPGVVPALFWSKDKLIPTSKKVGRGRGTLWGTAIGFDQASGWLRIGADGFNLSRPHELTPQYAGRLVRRGEVNDRMNGLKYEVIGWATREKPDEWQLFEPELALSATPNFNRSLVGSLLQAIIWLPVEATPGEYAWLRQKIEEVRVIIDERIRGMELLYRELRQQLNDIVLKAQLAAIEAGTVYPVYPTPIDLGNQKLMPLLRWVDRMLKQMGTCKLMPDNDPNWARRIAQIDTILVRLDQQARSDRISHEAEMAGLRTRLMTKQTEAVTRNRVHPAEPVESTEDEAEVAVEKPAAEPAKELAKEPAEEPAKELAKEPAEEPAKELAKEPAEEPAISVPPSVPKAPVQKRPRVT